MDNSSKKPVITVFAIFLLLLSAWLTYSIISFTNAIQTKSWPSVKGIVKSTDVKKVSSKGTSQYSPVIDYSYRIGNEEYFSNKYSSSTARGSSQWAKELIGKHPVNSPISVYYDPKDPKNSVLVQGLQSDNYWMLSLSLFSFVMVLLAFVQQIRTKNDKPRQS